jgi:putative endonuclease
MKSKLVSNKSKIIKSTVAIAKVDYYVYALLCSNDSVYIGMTKDIATRWEQHKSGRCGAAWTKRYPPIKMFYCEAVKGPIKKAMAREHELKTSTYRKKLKKYLLTGIAPTGLVPKKNIIIKSAEATAKAGLVPNKNIIIKSAEAVAKAGLVPNKNIIIKSAEAVAKAD